MSVLGTPSWTDQQEGHARWRTASRKMSLMPLYLCRANAQVYIEKLYYMTNLPFYFSVVSFILLVICFQYMSLSTLSNFCQVLHIPLSCSILKHLTMFAQSLVVLSMSSRVVFSVCQRTTKGTALSLLSSYLWKR